MCQGSAAAGGLRVFTMCVGGHVCFTVFLSKSVTMTVLALHCCHLAWQGRHTFGARATVLPAGAKLQALHSQSQAILCKPPAELISTHSFI